MTDASSGEMSEFGHMLEGIQETRRSCKRGAASIKFKNFFLKL